MASQALAKQLEEELNCSVCLDTYIDPKLLQCFHVYCQKCLVPLVDRDQQGKLGVPCPTCRQVTPIPDRGVAGLQSAFHINRFLESLHTFENRQDTPAPANQNVAPVNHCPVHEGKELELYCETCGELACLRGVLRGGRHVDHDCEEIKNAFEKYKEEIVISFEPMEKQLATIEEALQQLNNCCQEISDQRATTAENVHVTFQRLRDVLCARETELIGKLDRITQSKLKGLAAKRDQIETTLAQLNSCLHFMKESLKTGNEGEVLKMKTNTVRQVKELTTPFQPDILMFDTKADAVFSIPADITAMCRDYGLLYLPVDPSKCHITGKGAAVTSVGEESMAVLHAINSGGTQCEESIKLLECEVVSELTGARGSCDIERRGLSEYQINYRPTIKGRHLLHIKVHGQHIRGSPFAVAVRSPVEEFGTPILTLGGLEEPWGVAVNQRGEVVVTEWGGHCVSLFSPSGKKLETNNCCPGQLLYPRGVAVDGEGNILVVGSESGQIQKFTSEGQFLMSVDTESPDLIDIAINCSNSYVYVVDTVNHHVLVLNSDLTISSIFGTRGSDQGQFTYPGCICCDSTGKVYVADTRNDRIQVFTAEGEFLSIIGRRGHGRGELSKPVGIAIDASDMVYVGEWGNHRVSVFTSEGHFVTSFGRKGERLGEFECPRGLAVDDSGVVYVCDLENNRVQVF